ncbi:MAG: phenylalanine--tRNA ligase subunit beta [Candidatus Omnitrophica bacterium]|nr:phenylalanine--tRNA ligase subunit beta [Candidatus Omnitrophota bacterium]
MKFTYNWLKDYVEIKLRPGQLADKLTMAGLEVTNLEKAGNDWVFDVEVTPNRADLLSVIGIAREVAAITNSKCRAYSVERIADSKTCLSAKRYPLNAKTLKIDIEDKKDCPFYSAKIITDVKVGPSPSWLVRRLELVGIRSVNNIVDITNYVMLETGQPLHAFDLDKISALKIVVRRARKEEQIITIDEVKRPLEEDILVIATQRPIAIAGIMGGRDTQIEEATQNILLEAACFSPLVIRRGRKLLGLSSESSYRFERSIDIQGIETASWRTIELIRKLGGGNLVLSKKNSTVLSKTKSIKVDQDDTNRLLGETISIISAGRILKSLGFKVLKRKRTLKVSVPSFRQDIHTSIDLVEEIARINGYENIPRTLPRIKAQEEFSLNYKKIRKLKEVLVGLGLNEAVTYSLRSTLEFQRFGFEEKQSLKILNPLSNLNQVLSPFLFPRLLTACRYNFNYKQKSIGLFEIAKVFKNAKPPETYALAILLSGDNYSVLSLKGILEVVFVRLGIAEFVEILPGQRESWADLSAGICLKTENSSFQCGVFGRLKKEVSSLFSLKQDVFIAEIDLEEILKACAKAVKKYIPLSLYPQIEQDLSIIVKQDTPVGSIIKEIKELNFSYLVDVNIKDLYAGAQISSGFKSITISFVFRAPDHTLTDSEIEPLMSRIIHSLQDKFSAQLRT